jgi:apolipoprotein N-acyltransferase
MHFFLEDDADRLQSIRELLREYDVELIAGGPGRDAGARSPIFSSVFLVSPDGGIAARYDKQVLVPFSEYYPLGSDALMAREIDGARRYAPGSADAALLDTRLGRAGLLVCNEAMLPELAGERVRAGAELLVSPSNDSWIAGEGFAEHMLAVVGLRAIEQRRYLVRASTSGPSAVIDPYGRVKVRTTANSPWLLRGGVAPRRDLTPYARFGDAFAGACAALVAGVLLARACVRRAGRAGGARDRRRPAPAESCATRDPGNEFSRSSRNPDCVRGQTPSE